jgi:hypothetical protein
MACPDTTKPATEPVNGFHSVEQLAGGLNHNNTDAIRELQEQKLRRLYSFCQATAHTVAQLAFGVCR